jgi:CBS-domain-containing membrane protein
LTRVNALCRGKTTIMVRETVAQSEGVNEMKICDLMHKGVETMPPDTPVTKLARKMLEKDIGAIPVAPRISSGYGDGPRHHRESQANGKDISTLTAQDVMTKGVVCCHDTERVRDDAHHGGKADPPHSCHR